MAEPDTRTGELLLLTATVVLATTAGLAVTGTVGAQEEITGPGVAYIDSDSGTVSFVSEDGTRVDTGVDADFIGPVSDLTVDGTVEVPVIDATDGGAGDLMLVGPDGSTTVLDGSGEAGSAGNDLTALSIGDVDRDGTAEVIYPRNSAVYMAEPGDTPTQLTAQLQDGLDGVLGYGDFDGDSNPDIVLADGSQNINYLTNVAPDGSFDSQVTTSIGIGTSNGIGAGSLVDFDGDGTKRLAGVDGSQSVVLFDADGTRQTVYSNYQGAAKAQVGIVDITGSGTLDLVHIDGSSGNIVSAPFTGTTEPQTVTDESGTPISADRTGGVAGTAVGTLDSREAIVFESAVVEDPGDQVQITFNSTVTVADPTGAAEDVSATVDGSPVGVATVADGASNDTLDVTLATEVSSDETVTVSYSGSGESIVGANESFLVESFEAEPVTNNVSEPANFSVAISSTSAPVVAGETLQVTAAVENTGGRTAVQSIALSNFTAETVDAETLELAGGASATVDLGWDTVSADAGTGEVTVTSRNDSATASVKVDGNQPDGITVDVQPGNTTAGTAIEGPPAVTVTDQISEPLANATVTVTTASGDLPDGQTQVETDGSGVAVFDDLTLEAAGSYALTFGVENGTVTATSDSFAVVPAGVERVELSPADGQTVAAGETVEFGATAFDAFDNVVEDRDTAFTWTNATASGTFSEDTAGDYEVTATVGGVSAVVPVTVTPGEVASVDLSPATNQTIEAGSTLELSAVAFDAFDNVVEDENTAFDWSNADPTGVFSENTAGTYEVTAGFGGVAATTGVTVVASDVDTVELSPAENQSVVAGETVEFSATALDAFDNVVEDEDAVFDWTNTDATGVFAEANTGTYEVAASLNGVSSPTTAVTVGAGEVAEITLSLDEQTVAAGETLAIEATALDAAGNVVEDNDTAFTWTNADATGVFSEETVGTYSVAATLDDVTSAVTVTVEAGEVSAVELSPAGEQTVEAGTELSLGATAFDAFGNVVEDENTAFDWTNTDATGVFGETSAGDYAVTASLDGVSASVTVTVEPADVSSIQLLPGSGQTVTAGTTLQFHATALDAFGNIVTEANTAFNWSNTDPTGTFEAGDTGTYEVGATLDGVTSSTATVTVEPGNVSSVTLVPHANQTIEAGGTATFGATAFDAFGNVVEDENTAFVWTNASATGVFSETDAGSYQVTASLQGVSSPGTTVTVAAGEVESVELTPAGDQTVAAGESLDFTAAAVDAFGNVVEGDDTDFTWGNADETGSFNQTETGSYQVTATLADETSVATVTVEAGDTAAVALTPADDQTVAPGDLLGFDATAVDAFDNVVESDDGAFDWSNATDTGVFSEETAGSYTVTASLNNVTSPVTAVTVEPGEVDSVELSPAGDQTIDAGETIDFDATAVDTFGNTVENNDTAFTWLGTDEVGLFGEETAGTYEVTAGLSGVTTTVGVTVEEDDVGNGSIELTPPGNQTVDAGETIDFDATAVDAFGNVIEDDDTAFTWTNTDVTGVFSETTPGSYEVTASLGGTTVSATVTVETGDVETGGIQVTPPLDQTVTPGESVEFNATAVDAFGNVIEDDDTAFTWTNTDGTGMFAEESAGSYQVTASLDGVVSEPTTVTVEPAEAATVELSPATNLTVEPTEVVGFDATALDPFGNVVADEESAFEWTNATDGGIFVEDTPGTYAVTAAYDGAESQSTTTFVTVETPGTFLVSIESAPDVVEEDNVEVAAAVTNTGGATVTELVELEVGGLGTTATNVTLAPNEETVVTLTLETELGDAGNYAATVFTEADAAGTDLQVFRLTDILNVELAAVNAPVEVGADIEATIEVANSGNATGDRTLVVSAGQVGETGLDVELEGGESTQREISLETASQPSHVGQQELTIQLGEDTVSLGTVAVELPPVTPLLDPANDPDDDDRYEDINGGGEFNIFDIQALFNSVDSPRVQTHAWAYDFTDSDDVSIFDVQELFTELPDP